MKPILFILLAVLLLGSLTQAQSRVYLTDTISTTWQIDSLPANTGTITQITNKGSGTLYYAATASDTTVIDATHSRFIPIPSTYIFVITKTIPSAFFLKSSGSSVIEIVRW